MQRAHNYDVFTTAMSLQRIGANNPFAITMDYEKFYKLEKDNTYSVHFVNKKGFSIDQIKQLFSRYGNVVHVNTAGNLMGFKFVKYRTLCEVVRCLQGFANGDVIRLLPQKNKVHNASTKVYQGNSSKQEVINSEEENIDKKFSQVIEKTFNNKEHNDNTLVTSRSPECSLNSKADKINHDSISSISNPPTIGGNNNNSISTTNGDLKLQQTSNRNLYVNKNAYDGDIPDLISDSNIKNKELDAFSCSSSNESKNISLKIKIIPMQEVIVANIHKDYGVNYILHLFASYNPISATFVSTISETDMRYCHIYFRTSQDAVTVEEEFDNFPLSGKNLIVLRKSQLIKEAIV